MDLKAHIDSHMLQHIQMKFLSQVEPVNCSLTQSSAFLLKHNLKEVKEEGIKNQGEKKALHFHLFAEASF